MTDASYSLTGSLSPEERAEIAQLSYEEARAHLVEIVTQLERGAIPLEESMSLWERGEALARTCQARLDSARARLDAVTATHAHKQTAPHGQTADEISGSSPTHTSTPEATSTAAPHTPPTNEPGN